VHGEEEVANVKQKFDNDLAKIAVCLRMMNE